MVSNTLLAMNRENLRTDALDRKAAYAVSFVGSSMLVVVVRRPILGGEGKL